jgi:hypothetical protein
VNVTLDTEKLEYHVKVCHVIYGALFVAVELICVSH